MATIHKLTKDGATIFPATITDAVVHQDTGKTLTSMIKEYNVSELFPTEGIAGGNTYNLALAVQVLGTHLRASEKTGGIKLMFISSVSNCEEEYYLNKNVWSGNVSDWKQRFEVGDVVADPAGEWDPSTAEEYIDQQVATITGNLAGQTVARQTADTNLQNQVDTLAAAVGTGGTVDQRIQAEATARANADTALSNRITPLEQAVGSGGSIDTRISNAKSEIIGNATSACDTLGEAEALISAEKTRAQGVEATKADKATTLAGYGITDTYTKTEVNGLVSTPHQNYVTVQTYSALPASGSADTIYRVSNYDGSVPEVNVTKYSEYAWNGSQYIFLCVKSQIDEVFDITVYNSNTKYANLTAALAAVPQDLQRGGMSIKYVQTSDNKYVQWRNMNQNWSITESDWQGVDDEPTAGSSNLVESGGVQSYIGDLSTRNYIPRNYVSPRKYDTGALNQLIPVGGIDIIGSERIEYVKLAMITTPGANVYEEIVTQEFNIQSGDYYAGIMVKSSVTNTLRFIVFTSSGAYYETTVSLIANTWTRVVVPVIIDSSSDRLLYRYDVSNNCDMHIARPSLTKEKTTLGEIVDWYKENENVELQTLDKGLNLYKGCDIVDHYYSPDGVLNELSGYSITRPIKVEQGEQYTINHSHVIICYDKNNETVVSFNPYEAVFNTYTFTVPYGVNYIRTNVKEDFYENFAINKGTTVSSEENYELDGNLIKPASIHQEQLGEDVQTTVPDGSITLQKLASTLVQYFANGGNLTDGTITMTKLASEIVSYFANAANLSDGTITQGKLNAALIQWIQAQGGGSITNNADGISIIVNTLNQLSVNWESVGIFFTKNGDDTQNIISSIGAYNGKATLVILNDLTIHNSYTTFPSNLYKVVGAGGKIIPSGTPSDYIYLTFPDGCSFECGKYQMFHERVICNAASNGYLNGMALSDWWGVNGDGVTNCQISIDAFLASGFKNVRFTAGTYVAYPSNGLSGRNIYVDDDVIFDGVFHIAYGSFNDRTFCKNTHVYGKLVSTLRIGGAMIDGLYIPDGIHILGVNSNYINQTAEGGCKGVHFNFSNKNFEIGDIVVEQSVQQYHEGTPINVYAFGLDNGGGQDYEANHNIHVKSLTCGPNTAGSSGFDLMLLDGCYDITINRMVAAGGTTQENSILITNACHDIHLGNVDINFNNPSQNAVRIDGTNVMIDNLKINSEQGNGNWGLFFNDANDCFVSSVKTENQSQGIRLINSDNILVLNHISVNDTTPVADAGSTFKVLNTFS